MAFSCPEEEVITAGSVSPEEEAMLAAVRVILRRGRLQQASSVTAGGVGPEKPAAVMTGGVDHNLEQ